MTHSETLAFDILAERAAGRTYDRATPAVPALRPVTRRMTAAVAAIAVALGLFTASALPVRADNADLAKALAAIAVIALIAKAADADQTHPRPQPVKPGIPASCGFYIGGDRAPNYAESCIRRAGINAALPAPCAQPARVQGRPDRLYREPCLTRAGFRIDPRR